MNDDKIIEQLNRLTDELIDNIINTPDSEILQEVKEDYGTSDYLANKFREVLKKSKIEVGKQKLQLAKEKLKEINNQNQNVAARNGENISEEDAGKEYEKDF